jgi:hypothetical protein
MPNPMVVNFNPPNIAAGPGDVIMVERTDLRRVLAHHIDPQPGGQQLARMEPSHDFAG